MRGDIHHIAGAIKRVEEGFEGVKLGEREDIGADQCAASARVLDLHGRLATVIDKIEFHFRGGADLPAFGGVALKHAFKRAARVALKGGLVFFEHSCGHEIGVIRQPWHRNSAAACGLHVAVTVACFKNQWVVVDVCPPNIDVENREGHTDCAVFDFAHKIGGQALAAHPSVEVGGRDTKRT